MNGVFEPPPGEGYNLQQVYAENKKPFYFYWADRWWQLPHLQMLDFEIQVRVEGFSEVVDQATNAAELKTHVNDLFGLIMGGEQGGAWAQVDRPIGALLDILNQWLAHCGTGAGESAASTGSSKSTGRPSKRTSTGSTASASPKRSPARTRAAATQPGSS